MGLDYEFRLQFPHSALANALESVAALGPPDDRGTEVVFPDRIVHLPYSSHFQYGRTIHHEDTEDRSFDAVLRLPVDPVMERYLAADREQGGTITVDTDGYVALGYIYLTVCPQEAPGLAQFEFRPATSRLSLLFAASDSVRQTFVELLRSNDGLRGELHDSDYNWGPIVFWPETDPDFAPTNLLVLHNQLVPDTPYYRKTWDWLRDPSG